MFGDDMSRWDIEAARWFKDALEDLNVAEDLLKSSHYAASCFHSQQAAEKALKAVLYKRGIEARGHSVYSLLLEVGREYGETIIHLENYAKLLDKHYTPPRYPNLHPGIDLPAYQLYVMEDAEKCLEAAKAVINFVKKLLES